MLAGYTDKTGTAAKNQILSEQRAEWVKSILVSKYNINSSRINTIGKGQQGPNQESDQKNRKVEVIRVF
jgi:outer membrane protein OmpA-like peptidoglycan-associated protein